LKLTVITPFVIGFPRFRRDDSRAKAVCTAYCVILVVHPRIQKGLCRLQVQGCTLLAVFKVRCIFNDYVHKTSGELHQVLGVPFRSLVAITFHPCYRIGTAVEALNTLVNSIIDDNISTRIQTKVVSEVVFVLNFFAYELAYVRQKEVLTFHKVVHKDRER